MSEWLKERHWKCRVRISVPWVRIPPCPLFVVARNHKRLRRVATIVVVAVIVLTAICAIVFWRWHAWVTTPPRRIAVTPAVAGTIEDARMAAEWEPATGVLIAWPFHLPRELVVALASDV